MRKREGLYPAVGLNDLLGVFETRSLPTIDGVDELLVIPGNPMNFADFVVLETKHYAILLFNIDVLKAL